MLCCASPADLFQIVGMKLWLNQTAHVPLEKLRVRSGAWLAVLLCVLRDTPLCPCCQACIKRGNAVVDP